MPTFFRVRVLEGENGKVVVQRLEHEPHWKTIAVLTPETLVQTPGGVKPIGQATNEEIIAAVVVTPETLVQTPGGVKPIGQATNAVVANKKTPA